MIPDVGSQLRRGVVEYCILGSLDRDPMYGWQLAETLRAPGMIAGIGTLYPVLTRLREGGLIAAYEVVSTTGPTRKYYRLTDVGRSRLQEFRAQWPTYVRVVSDFIGGSS